MWTANSELFANIWNSQIAAPSWLPLASQAILKFFKSPKIYIEAFGSNVWGFICVGINFSNMVTSFDTALSYLIEVCIRQFFYCHCYHEGIVDWFDHSKLFLDVAKGLFNYVRLLLLLHYPHPFRMIETFVCFRCVIVIRIDNILATISFDIVQKIAYVALA